MWHFQELNKFDHLSLNIRQNNRYYRFGITYWTLARNLSNFWRLIHFIGQIPEMFIKMVDKQPVIKNISFDRSKSNESSIIELNYDANNVIQLLFEY